jgi:very-short-patch-repair endonuclease
MRHRHEIPESATPRARSLRKKMTGPERKLWSLLKNRKLGGLKIRRQVPIAGYIVDFSCAEANLVLELDGESHAERGEYDKRRQAEIESRGFSVLRIANDDVVRGDVEPVLMGILRAAGKELPDQKGAAESSP